MRTPESETFMAYSFKSIESESIESESIDAYFKEEVGLSKSDITKLKTLYTN